MYSQIVIYIVLLTTLLVTGTSIGRHSLNDKTDETDISTSTSHPNIVVLKWPEAKPYNPSFFPLDPDEEISVTTEASNEMERRQDFAIPAVHLMVPQSPDPDNPNQVPLPPHPYYRGESANPNSNNNDDDEEDDPETQWEKLREKIRLKPVNHHMFKTDGKHIPTLPYAPTQPLYELQYGIDQIRRAVHKINPMAGLANDVFKKFNIAVKVSSTANDLSVN